MAAGIALFGMVIAVVVCVCWCVHIPQKLLGKWGNKALIPGDPWSRSKDNAPESWLETLYLFAEALRCEAVAFFVTLSAMTRLCTSDIHGQQTLSQLNWKVFQLYCGKPVEGFVLLRSCGTARFVNCHHPDNARAQKISQLHSLESDTSELVSCTGIHTRRLLEGGDPETF